MIKRIGALVFAFTLLFAFAVPASADNPEGVPAGYTSYEYLQSDGQSWLSTGFRPNERTGFVLDFQLVSDDQTSVMDSLLGVRSSVTDNDYAFWISFTTSTPSNNYNVQIDNTTSFFTESEMTGGLYARHTLEVDRQNDLMYLDGFSKMCKALSSFQSAFELYAFASNIAGTSVDRPAIARIYSLQIVDNGEVVRDFVPVSNPLGEYGFWDREHDVFYGNLGAGSFTVGDVTGTGASEGDTVADVITDLNTQIHDIESGIYEDLHQYSAQVDPSTATNFSGNFLSAMSFISDTWSAAYGQLGDMQVIVTFPLFLAIAMLFIGRMNSVIASGAMKSRKNNDKKGGGDVG